MTKTVGWNPDTIIREWACLPGFSAVPLEHCWKIREKVLKVLVGVASSGVKVEKSLNEKENNILAE